MVVTLTLNPALDCVVKLDRLEPGGINRVREEYLFPGGKGVNVSLVLTELGIENEARGFLAGVTGMAYEALLRQYSVKSRFLQADQGFTRINTKISAQEETEVNGAGPRLGPKDLEALCATLEELGPEDYLVLSGSVPKGIKGAYGTILSRVAGKQVQVVVDTAGQELLDALSYRPFLIKPNREELSQLLHCSLESREDLERAVGILRDRGARNVLVSMGGDGSVLFTQDGRCLRALPVKGTPCNTVGAGDSMVAGFLAGWIGAQNWEAALRMGTAAGTATAFSFGIADGDRIRSYVEQVEIQEQ